MGGRRRDGQVGPGRRCHQVMIPYLAAVFISLELRITLGFGEAYFCPWLMIER